MEASFPKLFFRKKTFRFLEWLNGSGLNHVSNWCKNSSLKNFWCQKRAKNQFFLGKKAQMLRFSIRGGWLVDWLAWCGTFRHVCQEKFFRVPRVANIKKFTDVEKIYGRVVARTEYFFTWFIGGQWRQNKTRKVVAQPQWTKTKTSPALLCLWRQEGLHTGFELG